MSALLLLKTVGKHSLGASYLNPQIRQINHPPSPGRSGNCGSDKDKHCMISLKCGIRKRQTCKNSRMVVSRGRGWGIGERLFKGVNLQLVGKSVLET